MAGATSTDFQRLIIQMEARNARLEKDLAKAAGVADKTAGRIERRFNTMNKTLNSQASVLGKGLVKSLGVLGIGVGLTQLPKTISGIIKSSADIGVIADRIGLTTDAFQELRFAADLANVDVGTFDTSMAQFAKRMGEATTGAGDLAKILALNNVPLKDNQGNLRPINDLLLDYADLIKGAANEQEALFLATEAFGKSGGAMVSILGDGSIALRTIMQDAKDTGKVLDEELIRKAQAMDDEFDKVVQSMSIGWKTFVIEVVGGAIKLESSMDKLTLVWNKWLHKNIGGPFELRPENMKFVAKMADFNILSKLPGLQPPVSKASATQIPQKPDAAAESAAKAADKERQSVTDLIAKLQQEYELIAASDVQKQISNSLRDAGATATVKQKAQIASLITMIATEEAAMEAAAAAREAFSEGAKTFIHDITGAMDSGATFADALADSFQNLGKRLRDIAIDKAIDKLLGVLLGGIGGSGGGLGALISGIFGKVQGGMASAGTPIEVGESGREVFIPTTPGRIIPNNQLGGGDSRHIVIELVEGGLLRPIIRQEAADVSVKVSHATVRRNNEANSRRQALGG